MGIRKGILSCAVASLMTVGFGTTAITHAKKPNISTEKAVTAADYYRLGSKYESGDDGYEVDISKAIENYNSAISLGSIDALNARGVLAIQDGNEELARKFFKMAADKGDEIALFNLGNIENSKSKQGILNKPAIDLYSKSAKKKYSPALVALGDIYASGIGAPVDYKKAEDYFIKAADLNSDDAVNRLALMYLLEDGLDSGDETENSKKTAELIKRVADKGNPQALYILSMMYENGFHVQKDSKKSMDLLRKSADKGHPEALFSLGYLYLMGHNVNQDNAKGLELMKKAGMVGYGDASNNVGMAYLKGEIVKQDYKEAQKWLEQAIGQGSVLATHNVGLVYEKGLGVEVDYEKARKLFAIAADIGYTPSMIKMAEIYEQGLGVKVDHENARSWLMKAVQANDVDAMLILANSYYFGGYGYAIDKEKGIEWLNKAKSLGSQAAYATETRWKGYERSAKAAKYTESQKKS